MLGHQKAYQATAINRNITTVMRSKKNTLDTSDSSPGHTTIRFANRHHQVENPYKKIYLTRKSYDVHSSRYTSRRSSVNENSESNDASGKQLNESGFNEPASNNTTYTQGIYKEAFNDENIYSNNQDVSTFNEPMPNDSDFNFDDYNEATHENTEYENFDNSGDGNNRLFKITGVQ